jgi:addiction module RelE/StbE family toxin
MADRDGIFEYILADNPRAAVAVDERIEAAVRRLIEFPEIGRPGRVEGTRELTVSGLPYIIPYRIFGGTIRILRVLHAARIWPDEMSDE